MTTLLLVLMTFFIGFGSGGVYIVRQVQSGRVVAHGRIYLCKDTGPVVR